VLGADGVVEELQRELPGYQIKHLPAQVRKIRNVRQLGKAQILYVGPDHSDELGVAVAGVAAQPILLVTGEDRSLEAGGDIHFVLVDQRVRFEVSLPAAERSGLKISSKLLSVAIRVQTDRRSTAVLCEHRGVGESLNLVCNDRDVVQGGTRPTPSVGDPTQASSPSEEQRSVERSHVLESTPSSIQ